MTETAAFDVLTVHEPVLVNTLGHSVGAIVFGIFLFLILRDGRGAKLHASRLSFIAAALAFVWNVTSLGVMSRADKVSLFTAIATATSSCAFSLLPAVLLHISPAGRYRFIVAGGYALSLSAVAIHTSEFFVPAPDHHRFALDIITIGFGTLTAIAAGRLFANAEGGNRHRLLSRVVGTMALFLFAMSFVHFGGSERPHSWQLELVLHHAGIPLALFVLVQDYRFVLLDAFLRFLANIFLAAVVTFVAVGAARVLGVTVQLPGSGFTQGLLLVGACLMLTLFAALRSRFQLVLTRVLFRRPDIEKELEKLREQAASVQEETAFVDGAAALLADFMETRKVEALIDVRREILFPILASELPEARDLLAELGAEVIVPLRLPNSETRLVFLGRRKGGRPYLSEDLRALATLSAEVVEHVERFREMEMRRLVSQAELRALQSQIHPHFLFNALNTLYGVIPRPAATARRLVLNLADIFRYFLQTDRAYITLEEELAIVRAYLEIESSRLGSKLRTEIEADPDLLATSIPILTVEPLVENAVKHGVSAKSDGGSVRVIAEKADGGLRIRVQDSGRGFGAGRASSEGSGVGLKNVERRLRLCYGPEAHLQIESSATGTSVQFFVPGVPSGRAAGVAP